MEIISPLSGEMSVRVARLAAGRPAKHTQPSQMVCQCLGRSEVLRSLRHYLLAQRERHHTSWRREARKENEEEEVLDDPF